MQHKRIGVASEFSDDERHPLRHQAGHKRHIAREPVELGHQDAAFGRARGGEGGCELRAPIERIGALAGLGLDELGDDGEAFNFGETRNRRALRLDPEPRALLLPSRDTSSFEWPLRMRAYFFFSRGKFPSGMLSAPTTLMDPG